MCVSDNYKRSVSFDVLVCFHNYILDVSFLLIQVMIVLELVNNGDLRKYLKSLRSRYIPPAVSLY